MSIYMKADGISGSVTHSDYEGWIELKHIDFTGISQNIEHVVGRMNNRVSSFPTFGQVEIFKSVDESSLQLFQAACSVSAESSTF